MKAPNAINCLLQNEISALPSTRPNQSESTVYVGMPRTIALNNQNAGNVNIKSSIIENTRVVVKGMNSTG
ncbi:MAG: hypothetical protein CHKLHMKO_00519 [Candidatus Argoarchaeum ethanivorans]|uniref:Uncharacterized protein n=1 Tax=Candidatus Argoarchaeum ethanivorans TaxID=2608793 RepID=A0A811TD26_9EURY|nr:MAG: hypothetical protein CHKLHMKO_00519 [Candidatus Argoarchaeum ethanivorans]